MRVRKLTGEMKERVKEVDSALQGTQVFVFDVQTRGKNVPVGQKECQIGRKMLATLVLSPGKP